MIEVLVFEDFLVGFCKMYWGLEGDRKKGIFFSKGCISLGEISEGGKQQLNWNKRAKREIQKGGGW